MTIDRVLLNMKNSGSNMVLISVSRHRHIEDYINTIMELLRYSEKDLAIDYQPLTKMQRGDFRDKYPGLFNDPNHNTAYKKHNLVCR